MSSELIAKAIIWVDAERRQHEMEQALTKQREWKKELEEELRVAMAASLGLNPDACGIQPGCKKSPTTVHLFIISVEAALQGRQITSRTFSALVCPYCEMAPIEAVIQWKEENRA